MDIASSSLLRRAASAVLTFPLVLAGCGESVPSAGALHPVKGKVVFSKPEALLGLKIEFVPKSPSARPALGDLGPDGSFTLKSPDGDGAAEGEYGVRLMKPGGFPKGKFNSPISQEYFDEDGAFLSASIKPDTTEIPPFELKSNTGSGAKRRAADKND
ncbi:MAG TPA: hypothetical protein VGH33_08190 [Isosphaeraceae bacterium]|jgi:hypothetical protein